MLENIRLAFKGVWSHKMRSFLTMLGIIIGIAAIIAIVSTIKGNSEQMKRNMIGSGNNTVDVILRQGGYEYTIDSYSQVPSNIPQITQDVLDKILKLDTVESVSKFNSRFMDDSVFYQNTALSSLKIYGIDNSYFKTCNFGVRSGRWFIPDDYTEYRKVLILDTQAAKSLFGDSNPIGKTVEISQQPFTVIGIVEQRATYQLQISSVEEYYEYAQDKNGMLYIPNTTWPIIFNYDEPENVVVKATSTDNMVKAGKKTADILNEKLPSDSDIKYGMNNQQETASSLKVFSNSTDIMLLLVAGISLLVGGIGVMNIMLVSVTERTSEIGLKKAIGAKRGAILAQFLTEAAVLTSLGGIMGVAAGYASAQAIHYFTGNPVAIDVTASVIAVVFSMFIGILFGFVPSIRASNLDPIEALRRE